MDTRNFQDDMLFMVEDNLTGKDAILKSIAARAAQRPALSHYTADALYKALSAREKVGTTASGNGIALPHCALDEATEFVVGILTVRDGVDFGSLDKKKTRVFAFILGPTAERNVHIQLLSALSRILIDEAAVARMADTADSAALKETFAAYAREVDESHYLTPQKPRNQVTMILQNREYFDAFLQILAATTDASITVIDSNNAGNYMHRMPLFSSFWSDSQTSFNRVILTVVDRDKSNDLVRRINTALKSYERPKGILVTVQELAYTFGSLEF